MILNFRKRELRIELKEKEITKAKKQLHKRLDSDRQEWQKVNRKLANGITLELGRATHR